MSIVNLRGCTSPVSFSEKTRQYERSEWNYERVFRLGLLVGLGWDAKRIGADPLIQRTANNVRHQVLRLGGHFRDATMGVRLLQTSATFYDAEAEKRGMTREKLIQGMLEEIAKDKTLFDNIMDDGDRF